jgi:electron transfer flavoprotein alpha subunit
MDEIFVIAEHRTGKVNDVTFQMIQKAGNLCQNLSYRTTVLLLSGKGFPIPDEITLRSDRIIHIEDDRLENFNCDYYSAIIKSIIEDESPFLTFIGHTPWGMELAPALSIKTGYPLASDCVDVLIEDDRPKVIRPVYGGKLLTKTGFKRSAGYFITIRPGAFPGDQPEDKAGEVVKLELPSVFPETQKQFLEYVDTGVGEMDISQADLLVSIGRGIGEEENVQAMSELADKMGGVLSCSRPVVDKGWLPKCHQVGTSGKSVKPKVYLALGISGAFQHVAGISGTGTVIAVNKDKKAPIFRVADYGVVEDIFKIVNALKDLL